MKNHFSHLPMVIGTLIVSAANVTIAQDLAGTYSLGDEYGLGDAYGLGSVYDLFTRPDVARASADLDLSNSYAGSQWVDPDGSFTDTAIGMFGFGLSVSTEYNTNIFLDDKGGSGDWILNAAVHFSLSNDTGVNKWSVNYAPNFDSYMNNSDQDGVGHSLSGRYSREFAKSTLGVNLAYIHDRGSDRFAAGNIEGGRTKLGVNYNRILTGKTSMNFNFDTDLDAFTNTDFFDRKRYNARLSAHYQMTGKITVGPYVSLEHVDVDENPNHDAWSLGVSSSYQAFQKTAFTGTIGAEYREFEGDGDSVNNPIFELAATHSYSAKTSFNATIYHRIRASYVAVDESFEATGLRLGASHRWSDQLNIFLNANYEYDDYFAVGDEATSGYSVNYFQVNLGGSYRLNNGVRLVSSLGYRTNISDEDYLEYDNFVWSLGAAYAF